MDKSNNQTTERVVIDVAIGIIKNARGQLLVAKRPLHWLGGGFWEFPGGKVESDENPLMALKREIVEEVGLTVLDARPFMQITHDYPERTVILHAWEVISFSGEAAGLEGQEIRWQNLSDLMTLNMLPANHPIIEAILQRESKSENL